MDTDRGKAQPTDKLLRRQKANKILLLTGERADESVSRAKKPDWQIRGATAPRKGRLVVWHRALLHWTEDEIWDHLIRHQVPVPSSYAQGFSRHSCIHCIHKSWAEIVLAFVLHPGGAARRVAAEERAGHRVNLNYKYNGFIGYRAAWEFVFGAWTGKYSGQEARLEALEAIEVWKGEGKLFRLPEGAKVLNGNKQTTPLILITE